jgi:hypothetical protein
MKQNWTSRAEVIRRLSQVVPLERENNELKTAICCLQRELTDKEGYVSKLKFLLRERLTRIDDLNGKLEQARAQIQKLDGECEHLAELVKG